MAITLPDDSLGEATWGCGVTCECVWRIPRTHPPVACSVGPGVTKSSFRPSTYRDLSLWIWPCTVVLALPPPALSEKEEAAVVNSVLGRQGRGLPCPAPPFRPQALTCCTRFIERLNEGCVQWMKCSARDYRHTLHRSIDCSNGRSVHCFRNALGANSSDLNISPSFFSLSQSIGFCQIFLAAKSTWSLGYIYIDE